MRTVFDRNVLVSALLFEHSVPAQAFFGALIQGEVLLSAPLVFELHTVLYRPKFDRYLTDDQRETFLLSLVQSTTLVDITHSINVCRDNKDNMLLELALSGKADIIVTGDADLLVLHPFEGVVILKPEVFVTAYLSTNS